MPTVTAIDWKQRDAEEREKFEFIQKFVSECRSHWPGSRIVIRAHDAVSVDLST
jgi:hypothetical protein